MMLEQQTGRGNDSFLALRADTVFVFVLYLHWCQLYGGDVGGVHHGLWPVGSVRQQALPLLW